MYVIDVTDPHQVSRVLRYFEMMIDLAVSKGGTLRSIEVGIDPLDDGLKFRVDHGKWSPPMLGRIES